MKILPGLLLAACVSPCLTPPQASRQTGTQPTPDGTILATGDSCYTILASKDGKSQPIGLVFQSIHPLKENGLDLLNVVVHQHLSSGKFDMRDHFVVRRSDLRPLRLDSERNGSPHAHLEYSDRAITGWKIDNGGARHHIQVELNGPVWDGNLWGVTFAALPLHEGAEFHLPMFQYDRGLGSFTVNIFSQRKIATQQGEVDAWIIQAGLSPDELVEYRIGVSPRRELGYAAGPMSQEPGGNCEGLQ